VDSGTVGVKAVLRVDSATLMESLETVMRLNKHSQLATPKYGGSGKRNQTILINNYRLFISKFIRISEGNQNPYTLLNCPFSAFMQLDFLKQARCCLNTRATKILKNKW
jgi:hypothetical protein